MAGSHLAGYGQVRFEKVEIQDEWQEYTPVGEDTDDIVVTLLSDTLIRNPQTGAYVSSLQPVLMEEAEAAFVGTRIVGGFNRKWNLPLPQTMAIQAGSVFVYGHNPALLEKLQILKRTGIGERRAEGFGRIAVNWHKVEEMELVEKPKPQRSLSVTLRNSTSIDLAQRMVERMLRKQLDRELIIIVSRIKIRGSRPSNTQLSRIRIVARLALAHGDPQIIIEHLKKMKNTARDQFQRARIGTECLDDWLRGLAENPKKIWQNVDTRRITIGGIKPELTDNLALEYTVRLIDQVLRKKKEEASND